VKTTKRDAAQWRGKVVAGAAFSRWRAAFRTRLSREMTRISR
jgi:hypothetical protein